MASAAQYAQWIVDNQDKKGTPEFDTVAQAYQQAKSALVEPEASVAQFPAFASVPQQGDYEWSDVPFEAAKNLIPSAARMVGEIAGAVTSPIETATAIKNIMYGGIQNLLPEGAQEYLGRDQESIDAFNSLADFYAERYGTEDGFKRALAEDPAGIIADFATALTGVGGAVRGGASAAARAAQTTMLPRVKGALPPLEPLSRGLSSVASAAQKGSAIGQAIEPISALTKLAGSGASAAASGILGRTTGVGSLPIEEAFKAGVEGGERATAFREGMRSGNIEPILENAKQNLTALRQRRNQQYLEGMGNIAEMQQPLSFGGIDRAINQAFNKVSFKGQVTNQYAADAVSKAKAMVEAWKELDPAEFHTPVGMDALKQQIGSILDGISFEQSQARVAVSDIYNAIKSDIAAQAPVYSKVMKGYSEASDLIAEIEKTLSLNPRATVDTQIRKLSSIMRDNVNTNYGQRAKLLDELEGQPNMLRAPLAGAALHGATPRGIQGGVMGLTGLGAYGVGGIPLAAGSAAVSSPRLVGEAAYYGGRAASPIAKVPEWAFNKFPHLRLITDPRALMIAYQTAVASSAAQGNR